MKPENFEDEAQAIAAKLRTAFGYVRPAKRRCRFWANSYLSIFWVSVRFQRYNSAVQTAQPCAHALKADTQ